MGWVYLGVGGFVLVRVLYCGGLWEGSVGGELFSGDHARAGWGALWALIGRDREPTGGG